MKFLFVGSNQIDLYKIGGIENSIREFVFFLLKNNFKVTIFQIDQKRKGETYFNNKFGKLKIVYGNKFTIRYKILFSKFDVINFVQTPFESIIFTILFFVKKTFSRTTMCKFFFTYPPFKKYHFFIFIKYNYLIDKCFTFSKRLTNEIKTNIGDATFLYPPVSMCFNDYRAKKKSEKIKILFAGRFSKDKGLDIAIDVFKKLNKEKFYLGLSGYYKNNDDELFYSELIDALNVDYLNITKICNTQEQKSYLPLKDFDIIFLPYQSLHFTVDIPLIVLESLVSGCSIITSDIGDLSFLEGKIYAVSNYSKYQNFLDLINNFTILKKRNSNHKQFFSKSVGKKYLSSLNK